MSRRREKYTLFSRPGFLLSLSAIALILGLGASSSQTQPNRASSPDPVLESTLESEEVESQACHLDCCGVCQDQPDPPCPIVCI